MTDSKQTFIDQQIELANAIRDPNQSHPFEARRIAIYQELIYNNIEGFCANGFPVLKSVTKEDTWHLWVRGFMNDFTSHSPYFVDIAEQFLTYLVNQEPADQAIPAWRNELAHYEWVELYISLQENMDVANNNDIVRIVNEPALRFSVSRSAWALGYQYPVHTIAVENVERIKPEPTFLVVYQAPEDGQVAFLKTTGTVIHLLSLIEQQQSMTRAELSSLLMQEPFNQQPGQADAFLTEALQDLLIKRILVTENNI